MLISLEIYKEIPALKKIMFKKKFDSDFLYHRKDDKPAYISLFSHQYYNKGYFIKTDYCFGYKLFK